MEPYDPPKLVATAANIEMFFDNQIALYDAMIDVRKSTGRARDPETIEMKTLVQELRNMRWKARHIFVDADQ